MSNTNKWIFHTIYIIVYIANGFIGSVQDVGGHRRDARWSARSRCRCGLKEEDFSFLSRMSDDGVGAEADLEGRRK